MAAMKTVMRAMTVVVDAKFLVITGRIAMMAKIMAAKAPMVLGFATAGFDEPLDSGTTPLVHEIRSKCAAFSCASSGLKATRSAIRRSNFLTCP